MRTFEIPVVGDVTVQIDEAGNTRVVDFTAGDSAGLIGSDYVAYEIDLPSHLDVWHNGWLSRGEMNDADALPGGLDALMLADSELHKAIKALAGLRAIFEQMHLGKNSCPEGPEVECCDCYSAADQCEALYVLMGQLGLEVV